MANSGDKIVRGATPDDPKEKVIQRYTNNAQHTTLIDSEGKAVPMSAADPLPVRENSLLDKLDSIDTSLKILLVYFAQGFDEVLTKEDIED